MVRSMMCRVNLPKFLWGEAVKTANYIINRVPSKSVDKTPFELWTPRKPSLNHMHAWGCKAKVKLYNPNGKKFDPKTVSCFFIGYSERSKGFRFYCPNNHETKIVDTERAMFMENDMEFDSGTRKDDIIFDEEFEMMIESQPTSTSVEEPTPIPVTELNGSPIEEIKEAEDNLHQAQNNGEDITDVPDTPKKNIMQEDIMMESAQTIEDNVATINSPIIPRKSTRVKRSIAVVDFV
ncbi:hypothetical protein COP2_025366 [Malus domestica]